MRRDRVPRVVAGIEGEAVEDYEFHVLPPESEISSFSSPLAPIGGEGQGEGAVHGGEKNLPHPPSATLSPEGARGSKESVDDGAAGDHELDGFLDRHPALVHL
ncbi:hypothetical protein GMSM_06490 [Geomonas sp. Red276]